MQKKFNTPVLLMSFNRPDLTEKVIGQIRKVKPRKLYFAVDGPRSKKDYGKVIKVRKVLGKVDWKCDVKTLFPKRNFGPKYGPVHAMNWFFKNEKMGIILEDDVWTDVSFFWFAGELLEKYKNDLRVGSISGNNFQFGRKRGSAAYYFSRYSHSCGWATWKRAWELYDVEIKDYKQKCNIVLDKIFVRTLDKFYWKFIFDQIVSGQIDSAWDYQWNWMMWKNRMLGIIPNVNLVKNIGFGRVDATHTKLRSRFAEQKVDPIKFPLLIPVEVKRDVKADDFTQDTGYVLWKEVVMGLLRKSGFVKRHIIRRLQ